MMTTAEKPSLADAAEAVPVLRREMRGLLVLAAPIIGTMVSRMAMGFVDFVMVSRLGTEALAAISPATILVFTVLCLGGGAAMSIQTFAAQALGRRQPREAAAYAWQSIYMAAVFALLSVPVSRLSGPFWALIDAPPAVQALQAAYCKIAFWSMGLAVLTFGLEGFFNGVQKPSVSLTAALFALVFNAAANYCLIFGKFGCPALGIQGAAYATLIAWGVRAGLLLTVFLSREFNETFGTHGCWRLSTERLKGIARVGGPTAVQWVLDIGAWFVFLSLLMKGFGTAAMAATNIVLQYMHFSFMPAIGFGAALNSLVGHAIGEGRPALAVTRARACMILNGSYMGLIGLIFFFARYGLIRLMSVDPQSGLSDPSVVALGAGILIWAAVFQVSDAASITYMSALRGAGDTRWPAVVVVLDCWVVFIGGGYLVSRLLPGWGVHGPWMMCTVYIILYGWAMWWRFRRGAWRKIKLFKDEPQPVGPFPAAAEAGPVSVDAMTD
ncbi:MAG: MATE family efflux transporter [Phycisphaerae bacterium]